MNIEIESTRCATNERDYMMICPNCSHTMNDELTYCECCGSYLAAPQPKVRIVSTSTYRFDVYGQSDGNAPAASASTVQGNTALYNMYEPVGQPVISATPEAVRATMSASAPKSTARAQRRSRRLRPFLTVSIVSMLILGFGSGMSAFAADDMESRMPIVVEYEEIVTPDAAVPTIEADGAEVVTIEDDPVPMAAAPGRTTDPAADYIVDVEPEVADAPAPAVIANVATEEPQPEAVYEPLAPCTLEINGTRVPYIHSVFAPACPDNNAALWAGSDDTTDGSYGYFIGHNPGDFACVYALVPGNYVSLCDANGNLRNYTVTQLYDVPNTIFFHEVVEQLIPEGESLIMQTCIGDASFYRIVVCQ